MIYCVKCKSSTPDTNVVQVKSKNGRSMTKSKCSVCGTSKSQFTKSLKSGAGIETSKIASEAYKGRRKRTEVIDGYRYDPKISNRNIAVYKNDQGASIVANRGTDLTRKSTRFQDLKNDALIAIGQADKIKRIKKTVKKNEELQKQGYSVTNVGHSLGSRIALESSRQTGNPADLYSVGSSPFDRKYAQLNNVTSYRTQHDPIAHNAPRLGINDVIIPQSRNNPHTIDNFTDVANQSGGKRGRGRPRKLV